MVELATVRPRGMGRVSRVVSAYLILGFDRTRG